MHARTRRRADVEGVAARHRRRRGRVARTVARFELRAVAAPAIALTRLRDRAGVLAAERHTMERLVTDYLLRRSHGLTRVSG